METTFAHPKRIRTVFAMFLILLSITQFLTIRYVRFPSEDFQTTGVTTYISGGTKLTLSYISDFISGLVPPLVAFLVVITTRPGIKSKLVPAFLIILTRIFCTAPSSYLELVYGVYNTAEAIPLSLLFSLLYILYEYLLIIVCILLFKYAFSKAGKRNLKPEKAKIFDIDDPINFGILLSVVCTFIIGFINATAYVIAVIDANSGDCDGGEILDMVLSYIVPIVSAALQYAICAIVKNLICKHAKHQDPLVLEYGEESDEKTEDEK